MGDENYIINLVNAYKLEIVNDRREHLAVLIYKAIIARLVTYIRGEAYASEVDDILSKTLEAIFGGLDNVKAKTDQQFFSWCFGIAFHKAIDQRRKRKQQEDFETFSPGEIEASVLASFKESVLGQNHDFEWAVKQLNRLKPKCRYLIWKHVIDELDLKEIAALLKKTYDAVRVQVSRCLEDVGNI
jgi:RNA polymerase sigma factor (sigma-70 family)